MELTVIEGGDRFQQPGDRLKAGHVGAASGEYDWDVADPGFYRLVGPKGAGKTTLQFLLRQLSRSAEDLSIPISRGETDAWLEFGPRKVRARISAAGIPQQPEAEGPEITVEGIPGSIETVVHGDRLTSAALRAEHRLKALLRYAPIPTTPEHLDLLLGCLLIPQGTGLPPKDRAFGEISNELKQAWSDLTYALRESKRLAKYQPARDPEEIRSWLEGQPAKGLKSILGAHGLLIDLLNQTANTGGKAAVAQRAIKDRLAGQLEQAVKAAGVSALVLAREYDLEALKAEKQSARESLQVIRFDRKVRVNAEADREELRQTHGERPAVDTSRRDQLEEEIEPAELGFQEAEQEVHRRRTALENAESAAGHAKEGVYGAWTAFDDFVKQIATATGEAPDGQYRPSWGAQINVEIGTALLEALAASLAADPQAEVDSQQQRLEAAQGVRHAARQRLTALEEDFARERGRIEVDQLQAQAWDKAEAVLNSSVEGPDEDAVTEVGAVAESAEEAVRIAEAAESYQVIVAQHKAAMETANEIDLLVKAYRSAKDASWDYLGQVVTTTLELPWLMVDGTKIWFGFSRQTGELNQDAEAVEQGRRAAMIAQANAPDSSGARFLERVRELSEDVEWRDADDNEQVAEEGGWALSRAELIKACLKLWFSRQPRGAVRTISDQLTDAFDEATDAEVDAWCVELEMRVIGARARRAGDPEGLHLERVGGRS